jgi:hypothetical protein
VRVGRPSVAPGRSRPAGAAPNSEPGKPRSDQRGKQAHPCCSPARSAASPTTSASSCAAWPTRGCPSPAGATSTRAACGRSARVPRPARGGPARLRLRRLVGGGRLGRLGPQPELGRLLWHERDSLLQELAGLAPRPGRPGRLRPPVPGPGRPPLAVDGGRHRPGRLAPGAVGDRPGPLAMLGAIDVPARMSPSPAWFALTGTAPPWSRPRPPCRAPSPRPRWPPPPRTEAGRPVLSHPVGSVPPNSDPVRKGDLRWVGRRW